MKSSKQLDYDLKGLTRGTEVEPLAIVLLGLSVCGLFFILLLTIVCGILFAFAVIEQRCKDANVPDGSVVQDREKLRSPLQQVRQPTMQRNQTPSPVRR